MCGCAFGGRATAAILYRLRSTGPGGRPGVGGRAWLLQPAGSWARPGMEGHWGTAVSVPGLRPHHEPLARLAASLAVVCGDRHYRSFIPAFDSGRDGAPHRPPVRTPG